MQLLNSAAFSSPVGSTSTVPASWLDKLCLPAEETLSQELLSQALSARLQQVLELYDDYLVAYDRYRSNRGPRPEAGLLAVLRFLDELRPSDIDVLIQALKRLEVVAPCENAVKSFQRLGALINRLEADRRLKVLALLNEVKRLESHEKGEYKECFLRIRKDEIARLSMIVHSEMEILENSQASGRIAKLQIVKLLPLFIRYRLAMDTEDLDHATELISEMGQFSQMHLTLFGLHLTVKEMEAFQKRINHLRRRNLQMFQMKGWTEAARQATRLEQEIAECFLALSAEDRLEGQKALCRFENAESTVDEMVALSDLHKYSADIATKAKEWRALTSEVCKCRKIGQQMERVQNGIAIFGAGFAPPQLALMDEDYVQNKEKQVITSEMRAFMGFDELFNCMNAVMQY
ncbi:MAG: hypothetical protein C0507_05255 [Cyanobacteria bacterium PR.3.49]|jgi:hypothetical protein|nr:hypothetical protein [Cyanobacteria bacterium PR.3.49]